MSSILVKTVRSSTQTMIDRAIELLKDDHPWTLRGLHYQFVNHWPDDYPNVRGSYQKLSRAMMIAREQGWLPWNWLVDNVRQTLKLSSWSGLEDYAEAVRDCYRKNLWSRQAAYVEVFCEKDAMAAVLQLVTQKYDVPLNVIRGFTSGTFAYTVAQQWKRINKPTFAFYLGDWDPSGLDLERDLREKIARYSGMKNIDDRGRDGYVRTGEFQWVRLGVTADDFDQFELPPLWAKKTDKRAKAFEANHGGHCAELDAIPTHSLRERLENQITSLIDQHEWDRLKAVEQAEKETLNTFLDALKGAAA
ncbi:MAG: hypothetical protein HY000_02140 [Planctomycetes bacterium]|nr:hypothetical protein [Planctomycetota bacterium]